jgi:tetratricopeptide (TPR) repeat protein
MSNYGNSGRRIDVEGIILDAELLVKYRFVDRAVATLETAINSFPKHTDLREKLYEICLDFNLADKAVEQALALAALYAETGDIERANNILTEAKGINPQLSITGRLEAIQRNVGRRNYPPAYAGNHKVLTGDLAVVNFFDVVQIIENNKITSILTIQSDAITGRIYFNEGQIVDAQAENWRGIDAVRQFVELNQGMFELEQSAVEFKQNINAASNTNLILDLLRQIDEDRQQSGGDW